MVGLRSEGFAYEGPFDFALREGRWFTPKPLDPHGPYRPGAQRMCFGNAIVAAIIYGLPYVEGYAASIPNPMLPIHHAWNVDAEGNVVDTTWRWGAAYLGVEFSVERADDATWNGDAAVLIDHDRGYPIFRESWQGEPDDLVWPPSERLDALRAYPERSELRAIVERGVE
jgi:hypothetical protein